MAVSWNTFRARHKGMSKEELSDLWKKYKDGAYDLPPIDGEPDIDGEVARPVEETKVLKKLKSEISKNTHRMFKFL